LLERERERERERESSAVAFSVVAGVGAKCYNE